MERELGRRKRVRRRRLRRGDLVNREMVLLMF